MTQDFENDLKRRFAALDEALPSAQFTSQVMSELHKPRRRERLLGFTAILAAVAFLLFSFPYLKAAAAMAAGSARTVLAATDVSLADLSHSPLLYIYGTALGGYLLLWLMRRLQIRLM
ncbi:MAG TPA: hypothetical protein VK700_11830 [Steroidobacteraceae bacterium]|jgi:hypothetical protein|nr:hypothetical protein [Steroidobacteraceae bacterium]